MRIWGPALMMETTRSLLSSLDKFAQVILKGRQEERNNLTLSSTWLASSLVGTIMTQSVCAEGALCNKMLCKIGNKYENVFPEPVLARANMSLPIRPRGIAFS